jgi:hypothetical protein
VLDNINAHGVFVPHRIIKGRHLRASADNVDKKVDTYDGKNSFHGMAASVYQAIGDGGPLLEPIDLYSVSPGALVGAPNTCVKLVQCDITGSPKQLTSPCYSTYEVGIHASHFESELCNDMAWLLARSITRQPSQYTPSVDMGQQTDVSAICTIPKDTIAMNDTLLSTDECMGDMTLDPTDSPTSGTGDSPSTTIIIEDGQMETKYVPELVPVWSAYNSLKNRRPFIESAVIDKPYALPIINAPAHEWTTLVTTLDQLCRLNELVSGDGTKLVVTFDMDLYKRVLKLEQLDLQYKDKWVVCPGAFHTSLCALRCLGKTIEGSGIDEAWVEADMYSSVTVNQIINGNHYSRAVEAHEITLQVLFDLWLDTFFEEQPTVRAALEKCVEQLSIACASKHGVHEAHVELLVTMESLNLSKQLSDFDNRHAAQPMFQWARLYMRQILTLMQFHRATRQGDWYLHLSSLEKLCVYFFAYDRLDYAQNIPEYVARMYELQTADPEIWNDFRSKGFTVNTSNTIPFTRLGIDQAQDQAN